MKKLLLICSTLSAILLTSCVSEKVDDSRFKKGFYDGEHWKYKKLTNCKLSLEPVSSNRSFYAGESANFIFRLKNAGRNTANIREWRMNESENIKFYYAPYSKKIRSYKDPAWKCVKPEWTYKRSALLLNPGNSVLINCSLSFLKDIDPAKLGKKGKYYLVYAALNLTSVNAKTKFIKIKVK